MTKREKSMIYVVLILFVVVIIKSLYFDEVKVTGDQLKFKSFVGEIIRDEERYSGLLIEKGAAIYKVVHIKKMKDGGKSNIRYWNEKEKVWKNETISGQYEAKVRGYLFHVIPYKEFKVRSEWKEK